MQFYTGWAAEVEHRAIATVQNAAARLISALGPRDHVTSTMRDLHWLLLEQRIIYKLSLLLHLVKTGHSSQYLQELVTLTSDIASRSRLRSASSRRYETLYRLV